MTCPVGALTYSRTNPQPILSEDLSEIGETLSPLFPLSFHLVAIRLDLSGPPPECPLRTGQELRGMSAATGMARAKLIEIRMKSRESAAQVRGRDRPCYEAGTLRAASHPQQC